MKVHDVIFESNSRDGVNWTPWDLWRHEYTVDAGQIPMLTKDPLDEDMHSTPSRLIVFRYVLGAAGWTMLARQSNFNSQWGPAYKVIT